MWHALGNPSEWEISGHCVRHKPTGVKLWIGNGPIFFDGYEDTPKFMGFLERLITWRRYKRLRNLQVFVTMTQMKGAE